MKTEVYLYNDCLYEFFFVILGLCFDKLFSILTAVIS